MLHIILYFLEVLLFILLLIEFFFFTLWAIGNLKNKVPFVTCPKKILKNIESELNVKDGDVVYDLGSGDGRILFYLAERNPRAQYVGVDNGLLPVILSKIENFFRKKKNNGAVKIINENFFKTDLSKATHVFTYLYPNIMDDLLVKFDKELRPGTKLVSLSFKFTAKKPLKEIDLGRSKYKLGRKIYVYQF